jgi:hypothetical protein
MGSLKSAVVQDFLSNENFRKLFKKVKTKSFKEYLIERFSEVLNVQHHISIFLLIDKFYLVASS